VSPFDFDPPNEITLHRIVWHPEEFQDGSPTSSAVLPSSDLTNSDRFVSVDRSDLFDFAAASEIVSEQRKRGLGRGKEYETAKIVDLPCGGVRSVADEAGANPLSVTPEPEEFNPAHCGIRNTSGKKGRGYINFIRGEVMSLITRCWSLEPKGE